MDDVRARSGVGFWEALAFGCELAMLGALGVAGWSGADGTLARTALAVVLPGVALAVWAVWLAPRSAHRLGPAPRVGVQIALFVLAGLALAATGRPWWGLAVTAVSIVDVAVLVARGREV